MTWLRIAGHPARNFYRDARALPLLPTGEARHELLLSLGALRSSAGDETPNVTVTLRNDDGQCARLFAAPPLGAPVHLIDETGIVFAGVVNEIALSSAEARVGIVA